MGVQIDFYWVYIGILLIILLVGGISIYRHLKQEKDLKEKIERTFNKKGEQL